MRFLLPQEAETRLAAMNYQMQTVTIRSDGGLMPDVVWSLAKDLSSSSEPLCCSNHAPEKLLRKGGLDG